MDAIYFDGHSSKPHSVILKDQFEVLEIKGLDAFSDIERYWPYSDITVESFSRGQKTLLSFGDFSPERVEITGEHADMFAKIVLQHASNIKQYEYKITKMNPIRLVATSLVVLVSVISFYVFFKKEY